MGWLTGPGTCTIVLAICGCAASPRQADAPAAAQRPVVSFQVRSQAHGTDEWQPLNLEDVAHSGDRVALAVQTTSPVYLYVGRAVTDRPVMLLSPKGDGAATRIQAGQAYSVPDGTQGFELDTQIGEDNLYIVAAQAELSMDRAKEVMAAAPAAELERSRPRPPIASNGNRGPQSGSAGAPPSYLAKPVSQGLYAVRFTFQHQQ